MTSSESFKDFILDQLQGIPEVRVRRMFGSFGLYSGDVFFAIISDDVLYFKTNKETRKRYESFGMKPFAPSKTQTLKNYMEFPPDILEEKELLRRWAEEAIDVGMK